MLRPYNIRRFFNRDVFCQHCCIVPQSFLGLLGLGDRISGFASHIQDTLICALAYREYFNMFFHQGLFYASFCVYIKGLLLFTCGLCQDPCFCPTKKDVKNIRILRCRVLYWAHVCLGHFSTLFSCIHFSIIKCVWNSWFNITNTYISKGIYSTEYIICTLLGGYRDWELVQIHSCFIYDLYSYSRKLIFALCSIIQEWA